MLRQVVNVTDDLEFDDYEDRHAFGEIYEKILKDLQSAGNAGEFYTPRAVTDFMAKMLNPEIGEKVADFACGTGGFLTSVLKILDEKVKTAEDRELYKDSIFGIEKKALPYMLCVTNMLLHDVDSPNIIHGNSFDRNVREYSEDEKYDVVIMNPPYGGSEKKTVQNKKTILCTRKTIHFFVPDSSTSPFKQSCIITISCFFQLTCQNSGFIIRYKTYSIIIILCPNPFVFSSCLNIIT